MQVYVITDFAKESKINTGGKSYESEPTTTTFKKQLQSPTATIQHNRNTPQPTTTIINPNHNHNLQETQPQATTTIHHKYNLQKTHPQPFTTTTLHNRSNNPQVKTGRQGQRRPSPFTTSHHTSSQVTTQSTTTYHNSSRIQVNTNNQQTHHQVITNQLRSPQLTMKSKGKTPPPPGQCHLPYKSLRSHHQPHRQSPTFQHPVQCPHVARARHSPLDESATMDVQAPGLLSLITQE
ncbi:la-related protein Larp4B-like [Penaeus monodon]|uniref:la-related protein Larp4B-like n=1 Tax=Penaeus monodon TaxID=6687 RepID=UPI0018A77A4C|nr:la-related protein Larp4B-like [Penaeus monodon]